MELAPVNLESVAEPLILLDTSGVIVGINPAGLGMLGKAAPDTVGRPAGEFPILALALESLRRSGRRLADLEGGGPLSLALSTDITSNSSALVEVYQVTREGTSAVALRFRRATALESVAANPAASVSKGALVTERKKRVLVTDDDDMVRTIIAAVLRHRGFAVVEARDGEEAIERWQSESGDFDLVLLDLQMPRLGGVEVLQRLRILAPSLKVILLSGNLGDAANEPVIGVYYQPKPFQNEELIELVRRVMAE